MDWLIGIDLIGPVLGTVAGAVMMLWPDRDRTRLQERHRARLAELDSGAPEAFMEERRSLEAYPPPSTNGKVRLLGAILFVCGLGLSAAVIWGG